MPRFHSVRKVPDQRQQQARLGRRGDADRHQGNIHPGGKDVFSRRLLAEMLGNRAHIQRIRNRYARIPQFIAQDLGLNFMRHGGRHRDFSPLRVSIWRLSMPDIEYARS